MFKINWNYYIIDSDGFVFWFDEIVDIIYYSLVFCKKE